MRLTVDSLGEPVDLCSADDAGLVPAPEHLDTPLLEHCDAERLLQSHFAGEDQTGRLRAALGFEFDDLSGMGDEQVLGLAAARLAGGLWRLLHPASKQSRPFGAAGSPAAPLDERPEPMQWPAARTPLPMALAPAPNPAPPAPDWVDDTDQVAQAETLEQAARDGTPFCEVCARKRERLAHG